MTLELNTSSVPLNRQLAEKLNAEMRSTVMPVTVFVGIEAVFGFCGNILILYVFLFHYHKCNFKYFVLLLSFVDTTSTLTTLPGEIVTQTFWYVYPVPLVCKIKSFFNMFTVCGSAFGLLVISIDRFRKVCRPLQWQIKPKHALILIFTLLAASFIIAIPAPIFCGIRSYNTSYKGLNITVTVCEVDAKFKNSDYPVRYTVATEAILSVVMVTMLILYIFVCRKLITVKATGTKKANPAEYSQNPCSSVGWLSREIHHNDGYDNEYSDQVMSNEGKDNVDTTDSHISDVDSVAKNIPLFFLNSTAVKDSSYFIATENPAKNLPPPTETKNPSDSVENYSSKRRIRMASKRFSRRTSIRRKALIMFILTVLFMFTTILYLTCLRFIAKGILESMTKTQKSGFLFFFRLYFINHVINPILYGILDPKFRRTLKQILLSLMNRFLNRKPLHVRRHEPQI